MLYIVGCFEFFKSSLLCSCTAFCPVFSFRGGGEVLSDVLVMFCPSTIYTVDLTLQNNYLSIYLSICVTVCLYQFIYPSMYHLLSSRDVWRRQDFPGVRELVHADV